MQVLIVCKLQQIRVEKTASLCFGAYRTGRNLDTHLLFGGHRVQALVPITSVYYLPLEVDLLMAYHPIIKLI